MHVCAPVCWYTHVTATWNKFQKERTLETSKSPRGSGLKKKKNHQNQELKVPPFQNIPQPKNQDHYHSCHVKHWKCLRKFQCNGFISVVLDATSTEQQELFTQKLQQCCVVFDFLDSVTDLKSKEIKRATLNELVDYVSTNRGVLVESAYPEITDMVSVLVLKYPFQKSG